MKKKMYFVLILAVLLAGCNLPVTVNVKIFPTATSAATATPIKSPTPTSSPTPSPTPTPPPAAQVKIAEQALLLGDYEQARKEFQAALAASGDAELKAAAMLGIGRALYFENNYPAAMQAFKDVIAAYPKDQQISIAYFLLAKSQEASKLQGDAAQSYAKYLELRPGVLDDIILEMQGDDFADAGEPDAAVQAYQSAMTALGKLGSDTAGSVATIILKMGNAYVQKGDFANAIKQYTDAYEKSGSEYIKAHANFLLGKVYLTTGRPQQAYLRFLDSVANYPSYYDTYSGLVELVNAGVPVDDIQRGQVDYYAGKYGLAIDAFTRVADKVSNPDSSIFYFRALSHLELNEPGNAINDLDYIIQHYTSGNYLAKAVEEKATILWTTFDKYTEAAQELLQFVDKYPNDPEAAGFLFEAARIQERNSQLTDAAATWERMMNSYPSAENSFRGLFLAGVSYYRAKEYDKAAVTFQRYLVLATTPDEKASADLWIGKTNQAQGKPADAKTAWTQAAQLDPTGYYSERANELLSGGTPFKLTKPVDYGYNLDQERSDAEAWLRTTFKVPADTNLNGVDALAGDIHFQRGNALWDLGLYADARNEFETVRGSVLKDPVATYRLMNDLYQLGIYRSAILASRHILDLAGLDDVGTLKAPAYFNHIRFGIYYKDLVFQAAQTYDLNPLFILSVLRQESMFEGFATSGSGAMGLMQIMSPTGKEIATNLNWPEGYSDADLYRPVISIPMGASYLARQRTYFKDDLFATLAAYNGGPGNTIDWSQMSNGDPDLLLEVIRADETRSYIMNIYEYYNLYRILYERGN